MPHACAETVCKYPLTAWIHADLKIWAGQTSRSLEAEVNTVTLAIKYNAPFNSIVPARVLIQRSEQYHAYSETLADPHRASQPVRQNRGACRKAVGGRTVSRL